MQKTKKQILGIAGLVAVGIMTTIACAMPAPDAAAVTNDGSTVNINVLIGEGDTRIAILSPLDGSDISSNPEVRSSYEDSAKIEYYLGYTDDNGTEVETNVETFIPTERVGEHSFNLNLAPYGYRAFRLRAVAYGNAGTTREDTVAFNYSAIQVDPDKGESGNGDPIISITPDEDVEQIRVQVYDKDGRPLFVDENGQETSIIVDASAVDPVTGKLNIDLPFEQYGVDPGDYTVVVSAYDKDGNIISMVTSDIDYTAEGNSSSTKAPNTPNTGSTLFKDLNISRIDYILTGLVAFGTAAGFAIYLVVRKNRR